MAKNSLIELPVPFFRGVQSVCLILMDWYNKVVLKWGGVNVKHKHRRTVIIIKSIFKKIDSMLDENQILIFEINDRIGPIDRYMTYTEPLENFLKEKSWGIILNEGTFLSDNKEISGCDIHVELTHSANSKQIISQITILLEELGMPKGSTLTVHKTNERLAVGKMEGLALYLDKSFSSVPGFDIRKFAQDLHNNIGHTNLADRSWSSDKEDAVYFYNISFRDMEVKIRQYLAEYNLNGFERIVQIA